jgi:hypothetical protein
MVPVSTESRAGASPPFLLFGGQRRFSRFPNGRMFPNADHVPQAQLRNAFSKIVIIAVGNVG